MMVVFFVETNGKSSTRAERSDEQGKVEK